jgi:hypothetical protein
MVIILLHRRSAIILYSNPGYYMLVIDVKFGEKNVGMVDRVIRIILGIILLYIFLVNMVVAPWSYLVALIGLILLGTGIVGSCPLYSMLGMNTLGKKA